MDSSSSHTTQNWGFGDGQTSRVVSPSHQYTASGSYTVSLIIGTDKGCSDTISRQVQIHKLPDAHWHVSGLSPDYTFAADDTSHATLAYNWQFGDGDSATGWKINHSFKKAGSYKARLSIKDANGCESSFDSTLQITTGIEPELSGSNLYKLSIYPNPFRDEIQIDYSLNTASSVRIQLRDMLGREVATLENGMKSADSYHLEWNATDCDCPAGLYTVTMIIDDKVVTKQIVKVR
jgi:hypothetical protein